MIKGETTNGGTLKIKGEYDNMYWASLKKIHFYFNFIQHFLDKIKKIKVNQNIIIIHIYLISF